METCRFLKKDSISALNPLVTKNRLIRTMTLLVLVAAILVSTGALNAQGQTIVDGFVSKFVPRSPGAPPGDPRRLFDVYVPELFFTNPEMTFPIVYHLTGFLGDNTEYAASDRAVMDMMIDAGQIMPLIIVAPDPSVLIYGSNYYANSTLTGLFENYIIEELIPYVDAKYRQRKTPSGESRFYRAIMGQSMGGYGSFLYGVRHPELFIAFCGDSPTSFWLSNTNAASPPGNPIWRLMYTFNKLLMPGIMQNNGQLLPTNDDTTFLFFSWAATFSPNPARPFLVDYPFEVDDATLKPVIIQTSSGPSFVPAPSIIALWQTFDPILSLQANEQTLLRQAIYMDAGSNPITEIIDNVGARYFSDALTNLNINNQYLLFEGGHTTCTSIQELNCYRFSTNLKLFSAKFSEGGIFVPDVLTKIVGNATIELTGNAVMSINNKKVVGIETAPDQGITHTNITFNIRDSARLEIGNANTLGGGLQIGNTFGKSNLLFDPSLLKNTISCTFELNGPQATLQIGRQGFLGCGVGLNGNRTFLPNFWGVSSLANVASVNFKLIQGSFLHNQIASSLDPKSALFALGDCIDRAIAYTFTFDPQQVVISGGANLAQITLANLLHPTVQDTAGSIPPGGAYSVQVIVPNPNNLFDLFYGPPFGFYGSTTYYTNTLKVGIFSSSLMLTDTQKAPLPTPANLNQLFQYLQVADYFSQGTKRAAINDSDGTLTIAFTFPNNQGGEAIQRQTISLTEPCSPVSKNFDVTKIVQEGAVGIKLVTVNGQPTPLRIYDLNP